MEINGYMKQMPFTTSSRKHGFSIKTNKSYHKDCRMTEPTWNPHKQNYGPMNYRYSQMGDLDPIIADFDGNARYQKVAWYPTFHGSFSQIMGRSMAIYEEWNGTYEKLFKNPIACCNIQMYYVLTMAKNELEEAHRQLAYEEDV